MEIFVDDFIMLYRDGILVKTVRSPAGRLVRVVLVVVCCDHPAMCKLGGFPDHGSKRYFCPKCKMFHTSLREPCAFDHTSKSRFFSCVLHADAQLFVSAFVSRDSDEHRTRAHEFRDLPAEERDDFVREHGARWSELLRLPYFDPVRMMVIDPMHCVLLGLMKTQWYDGWIKTNALRQKTSVNARELDLIHEYLKNVRPSFFFVHADYSLCDFSSSFPRGLHAFPRTLATPQRVR